MNFPKWKYHRTEAAHVVEHAEAEAALGPTWVDSPAHLEFLEAEKEMASEVADEEAGYAKKTRAKKGK